MKIANRYRPFSHTPGCKIVALGTEYVLSVYPTALTIQSEKGRQIHIDWDLTGLVEQFTVTQDLEKNKIVVQGIAKEGFFSYELFADTHLLVRIDRAHMGELCGTLANDKISLKPKESKVLCTLDKPVTRDPLERLSFGNHKAQHWEKIHERSDPLEYLPFWFTAGQFAINQPAESSVGTLSYLNRCKELLSQGNPEKFLETLRELFYVGFEGILVPKLYDNKHLGVLSDQREEKKVTSQTLLREGYQLIRSMLLEQEGSHLAILPHLPACFHAGRCLDLKIEHGKCSIEWSKKLLKKVVILLDQPQTLHFSFQKPLKSFRLKGSAQDIRVRGVKMHCHDPVVLDKGVYILDRFEK